MKRGNPHPHRYKGGKVTKAIDLDKFTKIINNVEAVDTGKFGKLFMKSLLAILYWTGLRKTEVIGAIPHRYKTKREGWKWTEHIKGLTREDMRVEGNYLYVEAVARKHGKREGPLAVPLSLAYVDLIVEQWRHTAPKSKVWDISESYVWVLLKRVAPKLYLHFFRFNRVTKFAGNPKTSIRQICSWTGMTAQTVDSYLERSGRYSKELGRMMVDEK